MYVLRHEELSTQGEGRQREKRREADYGTRLDHSVTIHAFRVFPQPASEAKSESTPRSGVNASTMALKRPSA